jgi:hypothetical protein
MTNAIIDALTWNPDNPAASIRALQTALMSLQDEWADKIPPLGQISRNGQVFESDWNVFESDRADATFLHFDNETPDFRGEWANIDGVVQPVESEIQPGKSEFVSVGITSNRVLVTSTTATILTTTFTTTRPAKFFVFVPMLIDIISGTFTLLNLRIDTVSLYSWAPVGISTVWKPWWVVAASGEYAAGSHTIDLRATTAGGSTEFGAIAPLPNVTSTTPLGVITPSLAYVEVIYQ